MSISSNIQANKYSLNREKEKIVYKKQHDHTQLLNIKENEYLQKDLRINLDI